MPLPGSYIHGTALPPYLSETLWHPSQQVAAREFFLTVASPLSVGGLWLTPGSSFASACCIGPDVSYWPFVSGWTLTPVLAFSSLSSLTSQDLHGITASAFSHWSGYWRVGWFLGSSGIMRGKSNFLIGILTKNQLFRLLYSRKWSICCFLYFSKVFPGGSVVKHLPTNTEDAGSIPGFGRSPGEGNGNPHQYSCLENPMDKWTWQATVHGVARNWTWISNWHAHIHF